MSSGDIFDTKKIRRLVQLMQEHELTEIDLKQGDQQIRLRRGADTTVQHVTAVPTTAASPAESQPKPAKQEASPVVDANLDVIKSPMVGTFYSAPNPEAAAYVKVGDHVGPDSTVCIVEAMKVFNEIPAGISGKVVAVLVENGEPVEFGQPLFKVDASA